MMTAGPNATLLYYDPAMRLRQVTSGASTRLAYDGLDRILEADGADAVQRRYVFGPGIDEPLVWYEGSGTTDRRFLEGDERGSVIHLADAAGATLATNRYDEYGQLQATNLGNFGYTGQAWLPTIGEWYYKARNYDPKLGRFVQPDPMDIEGGVNFYAYVGDDPVNLIDPLGLDPAWCEGIDCGTIVVPGPGGGMGSGGAGGIGGGARGTGRSPRPVLNINPNSSAGRRQCPTVPRTNLGFGIGGTLFFLTKGGSAGANLNISVPITVWRTGLRGIQVSATANYTGLIGRGLFYGAGTNTAVGFSRHPAPSGTGKIEQSDVFQAGAAWGKGGEVTVPLPERGLPKEGTVNFGSRAGRGMYIGGGRQATLVLFRTRQWFCRP